MISKPIPIKVPLAPNGELAYWKSDMDPYIAKLEQEFATLKKQANCGYEHTHGVTCKKCGWEYNA